MDARSSGSMTGFWSDVYTVDPASCEAGWCKSRGPGPFPRPWPPAPRETRRHSSSSVIAPMLCPTSTTRAAPGAARRSWRAGRRPCGWGQFLVGGERRAAQAGPVPGDHVGDVAEVIALPCSTPSRRRPSRGRRRGSGIRPRRRVVDFHLDFAPVPSGRATHSRRPSADGGSIAATPAPRRPGRRPRALLAARVPAGDGTGPARRRATTAPSACAPPASIAVGVPARSQVETVRHRRVGASVLAAAVVQPDVRPLVPLAEQVRGSTPAARRRGRTTTTARTVAKMPSADFPPPTRLRKGARPRERPNLRHSATASDNPDAVAAPKMAIGAAGSYAWASPSDGDGAVPV